MHCLKASPLPWKKRNDKKKSAMKISTREMTTALVVDSPTPLAPPVVVKPQPQLTELMRVPNTRDLMHEVTKSNVVTAWTTESRIMLAETLYIVSASSTEQPMPIPKQRMLSTGLAIMHASVLGVTR
jgi:hypothetical protein